MNRQKSKALFARALRSIPGGVNSPVRAFKGVGGHPLFFQSGQGVHLQDADGNRYIDYIASWGPMILGHGNPQVVQAINAQANRALGFGAPTEQEIEMAELIVAAVPGIEQVRLVNSGTEATMSAIRLARGFTGRDLLIKFAGCYHGHVDSLLAKSGSGLLTLGIPDSLGVPEAVAMQTLTLPFNDLAAVREAIAAYRRQIAAIVLEPVAGNMGCVPPAPGFLEGLREVASEDGSLLIFDEVMTGFRVARGGAQARYGVTPDLTALGKVIGGGLPIGAFGGRREIMQRIAPAGDVYQAGTLSGNPLAVAAGLATLKALDDPFFDSLGQRTEYLAKGFETLAAKHGRRLTVNRVCGMFGLFFGVAEVSNFEQVTQADIQAFRRFFHAMLERGVYLAPSAFESGFVGSEHGPEVLDATLAAADQAFAAL